MDGPQDGTVRNLPSQIWQSLHKFFFADFSQNILSKEIANLFQLTGNGRVLISEIGVVSTAVNDAQGMASLFKIKLDALNLGMIRISEVDIDHAAHGGSRLIHQAAWLAEVHIFGILADLSDFHRAELPIKEQLVADGAHQHLKSGRRAQSAARKNG